jgi:hypothetical protein
MVSHKSDYRHIWTKCNARWLPPPSTKGSAPCFTGDRKLFPMLSYSAWRHVLREWGGKFVYLKSTLRDWMEVSALLKACVAEWGYPIRIHGGSNPYGNMRVTVHWWKPDFVDGADFNLILRISILPYERVRNIGAQTSNPLPTPAPYTPHAHAHAHTRASNSVPWRFVSRKDLLCVWQTNGSVCAVCAPVTTRSPLRLTCCCSDANSACGIYVSSPNCTSVLQDIRRAAPISLRQSLAKRLSFSSWNTYILRK